ncbi:MAG: hypothetical protein ABIS86_03915 [Streptosporangiaceae bacterium]
MTLTAQERDILQSIRTRTGQNALTPEIADALRRLLPDVDDVTTARVLLASCRVLREVAEKGDRFTVEVADVLGSAGMTAAELAAPELDQDATR